MTEEEKIAFSTISMKKGLIIIGVTQYRYFFYDVIYEDFYSAKELNLLGLVRNRIASNQIFGLAILFLISMFCFLYYPITQLLIVGSIILTIAIIYGLYIAIITKRRYLKISIGGLALNFRSRILHLDKVQKTIAFLHSFGNKIDKSEEIIPETEFESEIGNEIENQNEAEYDFV